MPNIWSKQAYVQGFDCEYIQFKKSVNVFERMDISVVEPSYKKTPLTDANSDGQSKSKRGEVALSQTQPAMGDRSGKRRK